MLQNAYFLAKIGADTAENEQHFAEIFRRSPAFRAPGAGQRRDAARAPPVGHDDQHRGGADFKFSIFIRSIYVALYTLTAALIII